MAEYISKEKLIEQYPELDGYTFADVPTTDIVHCGECYFYPRCGEGISLDSNWFCADGVRSENND